MNNCIRGFFDIGPQKLVTTCRDGGYEDGPWKGLGPPLLMAADFYSFPEYDNTSL